MAAVGFVARSIIFKLGTTAYECAVTSVVLQPDTPVQVTTTMCPDGTLSDVGETSWSLTGTANVDWHAASLYAFLIDHAGENVAFELHPTGEATGKVVGTVTIVPPTATMTVNQWATFPFNLPLDGKPTFTWLT